MPELPEVEVSRIGIEPLLAGRSVTGVIVRTPALRTPIPSNLEQQLLGRALRGITRRGKYLLFDLSTGSGGWLLLHLGMSGSLRIVSRQQAPAAHDHVDIAFGDRVLRLRDPRRFGVLDWIPGALPLTHPLLNLLGIEPLTPEFSGAWLFAACRSRSAPIKSLLMNSRFIVGIGNIYAAEALFQAGISPLRPAHKLSRLRCNTLVAAIKETLYQAISLGGSSVRDFVHSDGSAGYFQLACKVYGRGGAQCTRCSGIITEIRQAGRSTCYCPKCQR